MMDSKSAQGVVIQDCLSSFAYHYYLEASMLYNKF